MRQQNYKLDFTGKDIFSGIDAHLKSWKITIMVDGIAVKTFSQDPEARLLKDYLSTNYPGGSYHSAYEAGFCGFAPHRDLLARDKQYRHQPCRCPDHGQRKETKGRCKGQ